MNAIRLWLQSLGVCVAAALLPPADAGAQGQPNFFNVPHEVSCDTLAIAEYESYQGWPLPSGRPALVPFDLNLCAAKLSPQPSTTLLAPLIHTFEEVEKSSKQRNYESETPEERKQRNDADLLRHRAMLDDIRRNFEPLFDLCRTLVQPVDGKKFRVCYFGVDRKRASAPAIAAVDATINNAFPDKAAVCAPEPIRRSEHIEPEFLAFLRPDAASLSWDATREMLESDDFVCRSYAKSQNGLSRTTDECDRLVLSVVIPPNDMKVFEPVYGRPGIFGRDYLYPRLVSVYRGEWYVPGPNLSSDKTRSRGSAEGICMAPEDGHGWGLITHLLNVVMEN